jgi:hypothetical protein
MLNNLVLTALAVPAVLGDTHSVRLLQGGMCTGGEGGFSLRQNFTTRVADGPGFVIEDEHTNVLATGSVAGGSGSNSSVVSTFSGGCMDSSEWYLMPCACQAITMPGTDQRSTVTCQVTVQAQGNSFVGVCTGVYQYTQI